jgi:hypothetical protein
MSMIKHVGRHNNRKVVILWKMVPGEDNMCLLVYSDALPRLYHDDLMKVLESEIGQNAVELSDVLHRTVLSDGRNLLTTLHREGFIKKVSTNQVVVTPNPRSSVRLDELNEILRKMGQGEEAVKRMAEIDSQQGIRDPNKTTTVDDILSDTDLVKQRQEQATRMRAEAQGLLAEAERLEKEVAEMTPAPTVKKNAKKKKDVQAQV